MNQQSFGERVGEFVLKIVLIVGALWAVNHVKEHVFPKPTPMNLDQNLKFEEWRKRLREKEERKSYEGLQPFLPKPKGEL